MSLKSTFLSKVSTFWDFAAANSPSILTGTAVVGVITTAYFTIRATNEANRRIEEEKWRREEEKMQQLENVHGKVKVGEPEPITKLDTLSLCWTAYIPTAIIGSLTIACIFGVNSVSQRRNAALAAAYGLSAEALREYKEKLPGEVGPKKALKIHDDIQQDRIDRNPPDDKTIILAGKADMLVYDSVSGRYFRSDIEDIRKGILSAKEQYQEDGTFTLNDFYYILGIGETSIGNDLGWWGWNAQEINIQFSSNLTERGEPCLVLDYQVYPRYI